MRIANRLLALLLAVALGAAGVVVIVEVVVDKLDRAPLILDWHRVYRWAHRTTWDDSTLRIVAIALVVVGVLLLVVELLPRRLGRWAMHGGSDATDAGITRGGLASSVHAAVRRVPGVSGASVAVGRRKVKVVASAAARNENLSSALTQPVTAAAQERLDSLQLRRRPSVSVRVVARQG